MVLGKGVPAYSSKYGCLTYCVAGVAEAVGWIRLYPLFAEQLVPSIQFVEKFDIIRVAYDDERPEPGRPESRRIYPEFVEKLGHLEKSIARTQTLNKYTEPGDFLHDDSWRGKKTLGMIKPIEPSFRALKGMPKVQFRCGGSCSGHTCEVGELMRFDGFGRSIPQLGDADLKRFEGVRKGNLRFVMGTDSRYPQRWLLVSVHVIRRG